ncbi:MAG: hypothetical protein CMJ34_10775 [Phycisphaerae bacterium]|nr:hypothetical protein [Phycisphaerae bacterium]
MRDPVASYHGRMMQQTDPETCRLGAVSYLNTLPLIDGLDRVPGVRVVPDVPSALADRLVAGETDLSLCSVIDHQVSERPMELVPVGQIGCDGETRTVALFSRIPIEEIEEVACDVESHTSVALARVLLAERTGRSPAVTPFPPESDQVPDSVLLIGDKVARLAPPSSTHPHRVDLGIAWKELTGLPFVFAAWFRCSDADDATRARAERLAVLADHPRRRHATLVPTIARREAAAHGWSVPEAVHYLGTLIRYECTSRSIEAIERFHGLAARWGVIDGQRPLDVVPVETVDA